MPHGHAHLGPSQGLYFYMHTPRPFNHAHPQELDQWCGEVPHEHARAIRCLQEHADAPGFGDACRAEIAQHDQHLSADFRRGISLLKQHNLLHLVTPATPKIAQHDQLSAGCRCAC